MAAGSGGTSGVFAGASLGVVGVSAADAAVSAESSLDAQPVTAVKVKPIMATRPRICFMVGGYLTRILE
jgi:hypothetical protein